MVFNIIAFIGVCSAIYYALFQGVKNQRTFVSDGLITCLNILNITTAIMATIGVFYAQEMWPLWMANLPVSLVVIGVAFFLSGLLLWTPTWQEHLVPLLFLYAAIFAAAFTGLAKTI